MRRRIPWSFLLGLGTGLSVLALAMRGRRRGESRDAGTGSREPLPRVPEVVRSRGPTPVEAGLERPVASASPEIIPDRSSRSIPPPRPASVPAESRFEPVVPDAPEERDPSLEPRGGEPSTSRGQPVPPRVRRRH